MLYIICFGVVILAAIGLLMLVRATFGAPYAVEDEHGFHLENGADAELTPITLATPDLTFFGR
jgi:hypothetical protein